MTVNTQPHSGLALCEEYFNEFGQPLLDQHFVKERDRIAAGLVGMGSDCLGFDDELSRDHDWGPGFCLWLNVEDYNSIGRRLQISYDNLPKSYRGFQRTTSNWGRGRMGVQEIGRFYRSFIGLSQPPQKAMEWLVIPQSNLAACTSGEVFVDPIGEFTSIRNHLLAYYPPDVRLKKIAAHCMSAGQSGQYNYQRCLQRNDSYGAVYALGRFCEDVFGLLFLLNHRFMPYYKWHVRAAETLPRLGRPLAKQLTELCSAQKPERKLHLIQEICKQLCDEFVTQGLSNASEPILIDHGPEIFKQIKEPALQQLDIWYGGG